jgi:predicted ATPase
LQLIDGARRTLKDALGVQVLESLMLNCFADASVRARRPEPALALLEEFFPVAERKGQRAHLAEHHRLYGELMLLTGGAGSSAEAESRFRRAEAIAAEQGARSYELRAAMSLAQLMIDQGDAREAHETLAPKARWFSGEPESPDIRRAKGLLARTQGPLEGGT